MDSEKPMSCLSRTPCPAILWGHLPPGTVRLSNKLASLWRPAPAPTYEQALPKGWEFGSPTPAQVSISRPRRTRKKRDARPLSLDSSGQGQVSSASGHRTSGGRTQARGQEPWQPRDARSPGRGTHTRPPARLPGGTTSGTTMSCPPPALAGQGPRPPRQRPSRS